MSRPVVHAETGTASPEQAQELAEEAKVVYSENTGDTAADESE